MKSVLRSTPSTSTKYLGNRRRLPSSGGAEREEYTFVRRSLLRGETTIELQIPERAQLVKLLRTQPEILSFEGLSELRIQVGEYVVGLCYKSFLVRMDRI